MSIKRAPEGRRVQVRLRNPGLPPCLNLLKINSLRQGEEEIDLQLHRGEHDVGVLAPMAAAWPC